MITESEAPENGLKFHGILAIRFHFVVNAMIFTVNGIYSANNFFIMIMIISPETISFIKMFQAIIFFLASRFDLQT